MDCGRSLAHSRPPTVVVPDPPPAEYAQEGLARADGVVRFHEAYLEAVDTSGGTVSRETAAKVAVERYLEHVDIAVVTIIAAETDWAYH